MFLAASSSRRWRRGFATLAILGPAALVALLSARLLGSGQSAVRDSAANQRQAELEALADGGIMQGIFSLLTSRPDLLSGEPQGFTQPPDRTVRIRIQPVLPAQVATMGVMGVAGLDDAQNEAGRAFFQINAVAEDTAGAAFQRQVLLRRDPHHPAGYTMLDWRIVPAHAPRTQTGTETP